MNFSNRTAVAGILQENDIKISEKKKNNCGDRRHSYTISKTVTSEITTKKPDLNTAVLLLLALNAITLKPGSKI